MGQHSGAQIMNVTHFGHSLKEKPAGQQRAVTHLVLRLPEKRPFRLPCGLRFCTFRHDADVISPTRRSCPMGFEGFAEAVADKATQEAAKDQATKAGDAGLGLWGLPGGGTRKL